MLQLLSGKGYAIFLLHQIGGLFTTRNSKAIESCNRKNYAPVDPKLIPMQWYVFDRNS